MKKILSLLGAIGLVASTGATSVVSCGSPKNSDSSDNSKDANIIAWESMTTDEFLDSYDNLYETTIDGIDSSAVEQYDSIVQLLIDNSTQKWNGVTDSLSTDQVSSFQTYYNTLFSENFYNETKYSINRIESESATGDKVEEVKDIFKLLKLYNIAYKTCPQLEFYSSKYEKWISLLSNY